MSDPFVSADTTALRESTAILGLRGQILARIRERDEALAEVEVLRAENARLNELNGQQRRLIIDYSDQVAALRAALQRVLDDCTEDAEDMGPFGGPSGWTVERARVLLRDQEAPTDD